MSVGYDAVLARLREMKEIGDLSGKQDKVYGAAAGNMAEFDSSGQVRDSGKSSEDLAEKNGYYSEMGVGTAENLVDVRAVPVSRHFTFDSTGGENSIDDGRAVVDTIYGNTNIINQLVEDTHLNTVDGTGLVECSDGIAGDMESLKVYGQSLVKNQLVENGKAPIATASRWQGGDGTNLSVDDGALKGVCTTNYINFEQSRAYFWVSGHKYAIRLDFYGHNVTAFHIYTGTQRGVSNIAVSVQDSWGTYSAVFSASPNLVSTSLIQILANEQQPGDYAKIRNVQLVDLTELFNNDTAKISSITSWDDLVALMPEYASYVDYDAGTVVGRSGKAVACSKNLFGGSAFKAWLLELGGTDLGDGVVSIESNKFGDNPLIPYQFFKQDANYTFIVKGYNANINYNRTANLTFLKLSGAIGYINFDNNTSVEYPLSNAIVMNTPKRIYGRHGNGTPVFYTDECGLFEGEVAVEDFEPYVDNGNAEFTGLHGVGEARDEQDVITGAVTRRIGVLDLGSITPSAGYVDADESHPYGYVVLGNIAGGVSNLSMHSMCANYMGREYNVDKSLVGTSSSNQLWLVDSAFIGYTAAQVKAALSGVMLYYELAEPTSASVTPQPLDVVAGQNTVYETSDTTITATPMSMQYTGTDYALETQAASKYIKRINGTESLVTGVSSIDVVGGRDKVYDLTKWFGAGMEPATIAAFYALYPEYNGTDMPYTLGKLIGFNGTGIKTVGFNQWSWSDVFVTDESKDPTDARQFEEGKWIRGISYSTDNWRPRYCVASVTDNVLSIGRNPEFTNAYPVGRPMRLLPGIYQITWDYSGTLGSHAYTSVMFCGIDCMHQSHSFENTTTKTLTFTVPSTAYWTVICFSNDSNTPAYISNITLHLVWSGYRNGDTEEYWERTLGLPVSTIQDHDGNPVFPWGMHHINGVHDELTATRAVRRIGRVVYDGTETWAIEQGTSVKIFSIDLPLDCVQLDMNNVKCSDYRTVNASSLSNLVPGTFGHRYQRGKFFFAHRDQTLNLQGIKSYLAALYAAGTPLTVYYELAEPIITTFDNDPVTGSANQTVALNMLFTVSDFGTEQLLPVNEVGNVVTSPFMGDVKYNIDFVKQISNMDKNMTNMGTLDSLLQAFGQAAGVTFIKEWNPVSQSYDITVSDEAT